VATWWSPFVDVATSRRPPLERIPPLAAYGRVTLVLGVAVPSN